MGTVLVVVGSVVGVGMSVKVHSALVSFRATRAADLSRAVLTPHAGHS
jgi:hypothetical protein